MKKVECQRIDAFELWCWRRLLTVPWTARRSNQSILKGINHEYSLDQLMLELKLQYLGHLMWRANSLEKTLMLEKIETRGEGDDRGQDGWMASLTQWTWIWASSWRQLRTGKPRVFSPWGCKESDMTERLNNKKIQKLMLSLNKQKILDQQSMGSQRVRHDWVTKHSTA